MDPPTPSLLYTSIFYMTIIATQTLSLDPKFKACEPKSCGRGPKISYPFYLSGKQESFCGYPSFELTCDDEQKLPVLGISGEDYVIKNISYLTQSFQVVNSKASHDDPCPSPLNNLTLHRTPYFVNPSYINFTILYNCSDHMLEDFRTYPLSCPGNTSLRSFGVFDRENLENEKKIASRSCQNLVDVPVLASDESDLIGLTYVEILKRGFVLNWAANSCFRCISSGGRCGTDQQEFVCLCPNGPKLHDTCKNGKDL